MNTPCKHVRGRSDFVYLCTNEPDNVVYSQVAEYIRKQEENGLFFELIFLLQTRSYIKYIMGGFPNYKRIRKLLNGRVKCYPAPFQGKKIGTNIRGSYVNNHVNNKKKTVIHARGAASAYTAHQMALKGKDVSFVYDVRGDYLAEYEFIAKQSGMDSEEMSKGVKSITEKEKATAQSANHIFCVSSVLKKRLTERYNLDETKFTIVPCCADEERFKYDPQAREAMRRDLGLENKHVFIYSGGVHYWHCPETLFSVVSNLLDAFAGSFFVALTGDVTTASTYAQRYLPDGRYLIDCVLPEAVPTYLMAGDTGILLRDRHPLNEVAAPTKFAEYMLAGLQVVISDNIGDYSDYVARNSLGGVWKNDLPVESNLENLSIILEGKLPSSRQYISDLGLRDFSKSAYNTVMSDIYVQLKYS